MLSKMHVMEAVILVVLHRTLFFTHTRNLAMEIFRNVEKSDRSVKNR